MVITSLETAVMTVAMYCRKGVGFGMSRLVCFQLITGLAVSSAWQLVITFAQMNLTKGNEEYEEKPNQPHGFMVPGDFNMIRTRF